jgi:hypothetical protein
LDATTEHDATASRASASEHREGVPSEVDAPSQVATRPLDSTTEPGAAPPGASVSEHREGAPPAGAPSLLDATTARSLINPKQFLMHRAEARRVLEAVLVCYRGVRFNADGVPEHIVPHDGTPEHLPEWPTWKHYVANLPQASEIVGPGIVSITAEFIEATADPNRRGQKRCDFVVYRADGSYWRLHPGSKPSNDATPHLFRAPIPPAADIPRGAPEHTPQASQAWMPSEMQLPFTAAQAHTVPQGDRIGKQKVWQWVQSTDFGPSGDDLDITSGAAFTWWLWVATLEQSHGNVVGAGILSATVTTDGHSWAQFRFTRCDDTGCLVLLRKEKHGTLILSIEDGR